eukprot:GHRR01006307.1.p1 GENE.GHRR01006307.1~~GHRR01006307.1.p1  ORF type:complete len:243 (+),score=67.31 GHRR01006307.1:226-954(+)
MAYSKVPKTQFGGHLVAQPRLLVHTNARNVRAKFKTITETASVVLAPDEQRSLEAVIKAKGLQHLIGANGSSTSSTSANTVPLQLPDGVSKQLLTTIKMGVQKEVEDLQQLEGAMLLAEQLHYAGSSSGAGTQQGSLSPVNNVLVSSVSPQSVDIWQPIFASSGGFPRLLYIPGQGDQQTLFQHAVSCLVGVNFLDLCLYPGLRLSLEETVLHCLYCSRSLPSEGMLSWSIHAGLLATRQCE